MKPSSFKKHSFQPALLHNNSSSISRGGGGGRADRFKFLQSKTSTVVENMDNFSMKTLLFQERVLTSRDMQDLSRCDTDKQSNLRIVQLLVERKSQRSLDVFVSGLHETKLENPSHEDLLVELAELTPEMAD